MKVNKDICKGCYKKHNMDWDKFDWQWQQQWCPIVINGRKTAMTLIDDEMPDRCEYKLEHMVMK